MVSSTDEEIRKFDKNFTFKSFGVSIGLASDSWHLLEQGRELVGAAFGGEAEIFETGGEAPRSVFGITLEGDRHCLYKNGRPESSSDSERNFFKYLNSLLRLEVAEFASELVFIHAGVVGWRGRAIILPGTSFAGKSTLTAELIARGAEYYSDEYAVVRADGRIIPFPRKLSIRDPKDGIETSHSAEELGGTRGTGPIDTGLVLFTEYKESAGWEPQMLSPGGGIMELIPHTLSFRQAPSFALKVLELMLRNAIMVKSPRGDVKEFAKFLLEFFDNNTKLAKMT